MNGNAAGPPRAPERSGTMCQLIGKCVALGVIVGAACFVVAEYTPYLRLFGVNRMVYGAIHKAMQRTPSAKVVVLGDSVCWQLYRPGSDEEGIYSLACNYGASLLGQRILMDLWLEQNPKARGRDIVLVLHPDSFNNSLGNPESYNCFLKPFWRRQWRDRYDKVELERIEKFHYYWLSQLPFVQMSSWSPQEVPSFAEDPRIAGYGLSRLSLYELAKMEESANRHGVRLHIRAGILRESLRHLDLSLFERQIEAAGLDTLFSEYTSSMKYLPDDLFRDERHLKNPKLLGRDPLGLRALETDMSVQR